MDDRRQDGAAWSVARFRNCTLNRLRRDLVREGAPCALEPRAFDVLVSLIEQRHKVVPRESFEYGASSAGALARTIMKIRRAIADVDPKHPLIKTIHRVGYRFVGELELVMPGAQSPALRPDELRSGINHRLVLLPFRNDTSEGELDWVELGLMSLVAKALQPRTPTSIVPAQDVLAVLDGLPTSAPLELRRQAVESRLGAQSIISGRLTGGHGHYLLFFELQSVDGTCTRGAVAGNDAVRMANDAVALMRRWLAPHAMVQPTVTQDLGDEFVDQAFALALQRSRDNRLLEAERLLDVIVTVGVDRLEVQYEASRVRVELARPQALAPIQAIEDRVVRSDDAAMQSSTQALRARYLGQQGRMAEAASTMLRAIDIAEAGNLTDLAAQCMVDCAFYLAASFDDRAQAMLSRALSLAETLGDQALLSRAYVSAGRAAKCRSDWLAARRHLELALAVAQTLGETHQFVAKTHLACAHFELGRWDLAAQMGLAAFRVARISGQQPHLGTAAMVATAALMSSRRLRELARFLAELESYELQPSPADAMAREVFGRAALLSAVGRPDEALARIDGTLVLCIEQPCLGTLCRAASLAALIQNGRYHDAEQLCEELRRSPEAMKDARLGPWIQRALALSEGFGHGDLASALERLESVVKTTPMSRAHAITCMDAAWLRLERGEPGVARRLVEHLPEWLERTPSGIQIGARLRYESGDWHGASTVQRRFVESCAETVTPVQHELLRLYEQAWQDGRAAALPPLGMPLDVCWRVAPQVLAELPVALGESVPA